MADDTAADTTITMTGDYTITANFAETGVTYDLTVSSTAGGSVTEPGEPGPFTYDAGTPVALLAVPELGYGFLNWSGDVGMVADASAADTTITMNGNYSIQANFVPPEVLTTIPLTTGWNTFSTPIDLDPSSDTWETLFAFSGIEDEDVGAIYRYNGSTGQWEPITSGAVQPLEGYYVNMLSEGWVSIVPYWDNPEPDLLPRKELAHQLNFIGIPSLVDWDVVTALGDIYLVKGVGYSRVINPEENPNDWLGTEYLRDIPPVPTMVAFKAYWVIMGWWEGPLYLYGLLPPAPPAP